MGTTTIYKQSILIFLSILIIGGCKGQTNTVDDEENMVQDNMWKVIGPGGGGGVLKPTISPFDENFVMTHCDMTGVYISQNGGQNWKMKNLWNIPDDFEFDPVSPNTVYIATRGFLHSEDRGSGISMLLRSDNKGEQWRIVFPDISKSTKVEKLQSTNLKPSEIIEGALDGTIQKIRVDPFDNKRIYIGLAPLVDYMSRGSKPIDTNSARLVLSTDHGVTWEVIADLPGKSVLGIFPGNKNRQVTVFTESSCARINEITGEIKIFPLPVKYIIAV